MARAVNQITSDIILIEQDSIDIHKTVQLARVMYILSERTRNENALQDEKDPSSIVKNMITATSNLIKANRNTKAESNFNKFASNVMGLSKTTIPLCETGFKWLAKTVSNIVLMA